MNSVRVSRVTHGVAAAAGVRGGADRVGWVDVARALAILLVVFYHSSLFVADAGVESVWVRISKTLETFRMPLFFFVAGIFALRAISGSLRSLIRGRVGMLLWVYLVWSLIWQIAFSLAPPLRTMTAPVPVWLSIPRSLVWPSAGTWFLYALAAFFLLAWVIRRLPPWLQLTAALALSIPFGLRWVTTGNGAFDNIGLYFVYFLAAVHTGPWVLRIVPRTRAWHAVALLVLFVGMSYSYLYLGLRTVPGFRILVSLAAIAAGVTLAFQLSRLPRTMWLQMLGRRTLPIYLLHVYPVLWAAVLLIPLGGVDGIVAALIPPALAVFSILFALTVWGCTRRVPGLYDLPRRRIGKHRATPRPVTTGDSGPVVIPGARNGSAARTGGPNARVGT